MELKEAKAENDLDNMKTRYLEQINVSRELEEKLRKVNEQLVRLQASQRSSLQNTEAARILLDVTQELVKGMFEKIEDKLS